MSNRWRVRTGAALVVVMTLAACAPGGNGDDEAVVDLDDPAATDDAPEEPADDPVDDDSETAAPGDAEPLQVGFITTMTGPAAASGLGQLAGFELWLELNDDILGGAPVEFHAEDDDGTPDGGVEAARRLVENVDVDLIIGPLLGNVGLAIGDYLGGVDTPQFYTIPAPEQFLRGKPDAMYLGGGTPAQAAHAVGEYVADELGLERAVIFCQDYAYGHELCGGAVNTFTDRGGVIVDRVYTPLGTGDYAPFVGELGGQDFDVIISGLVGADSIIFQRTLDDFGFADVPVVSTLNTMDQSIVREVGPSVIGRQSIGPFAEGADNEATQTFVQAYEDDRGELPTATAAAGYFAGQWIDAALTELGGEVPSTEAFIEALNAVTFSDTVFGPITIDERGNVVFGEMLLREAQEREDGAVWNVPVGVVAQDVGPTYTYDYDTYLEQPAYSPDYVGEDWPTDCEAFASDCPL